MPPALTHDEEMQLLKRELVLMFGHMQRIRKELAAISHTEPNEDHFSRMADQLDAIVEATEEATNTIMGSMEAVDGLVGQVRAVAAAPEAGPLLDAITDKVNAVFEACSFQDLTGQRITKVVQSMKFLEERVNAIILMWGREELAKVVVDLKESDPDKALMHGPQRKGEGVDQSEVDQMFSQSDIDTMFSQNDIDKMFG